MQILFSNTARKVWCESARHRAESRRCSRAKEEACEVQRVVAPTAGRADPRVATGTTLLIQSIGSFTARTLNTAFVDE